MIIYLVDLSLDFESIEFNSDDYWIQVVLGYSSAYRGYTDNIVKANLYAEMLDDIFKGRLKINIETIDIPNVYNHEIDLIDEYVNDYCSGYINQPMFGVSYRPSSEIKVYNMNNGNSYYMTSTLHHMLGEYFKETSVFSNNIGMLDTVLTIGKLFNVNKYFINDDMAEFNYAIKKFIGKMLDGASQLNSLHPSMCNDFDIEYMIYWNSYTLKFMSIKYLGGAN